MNPLKGIVLAVVELQGMWADSVIMGILRDLRFLCKTVGTELCKARFEMAHCQR